MTNQLKMANLKMPDNLDSLVITNIRYPLMIMIVIIHSFINGVDRNVYPFFYYTQHILSEVIGYVAVFLFFFISGYLMFFGIAEYDYNTFGSKLKRRIKSLVVPYILWNVIYLLIAIGYTYHKEGIFLCSDWNLIDWLKPFYCYGENSRFPIAGPLWFVRDLFIVFLLSPLIYLFIKRWGVILPLLCIALSISDIIPNIFHVRFSSFAYVVWGGYFSINKINISSLCMKYKLLIFAAYIIVIPISILLENTNYSCVVDNISKFIGVFALFTLFSLITVYSGKDRILPSYITSATFFLFAMHLILILYCREFVLTHFVVVESEISLFSVYFSTIIICVFFCTVAYHGSRTISPTFTALLTGSR